MTNRHEDSVTVIDTSNHTLVDTDLAMPGVQPIPVGDGPNGGSRFIGPPVSGGDAFVSKLTGLSGSP